MDTNFSANQKVVPEDLDAFIPDAYRNRACMRRKECASVSGYSVAFFARRAWASQDPPNKNGIYPTRQFFQWLRDYLNGKER